MRNENNDEDDDEDVVDGIAEREATGGLGS